MIEIKQVLYTYRRLARLTGRFHTLDELRGLKVLEYSCLMPEKPLETNKEYQLEKNTIIKAWQGLGKVEQIVLFHAYMNIEPKSNECIAEELSYSKRNIERLKRQGIISFSKKYKEIKSM